MNLNHYMEELRALIEAEIEAIIAVSKAPDQLKEAMAYSLVDGGKRFRPTLLLMLLDTLGIPKEKGLKTAVALEMIHTYSLIHDDLPAMDNDDLRRGKPTNHRQFGEAMAILAGDGLLTDAFGLVAGDNQILMTTRIELIRYLANAAGSSGMIAGQVFDMAASGEVPTDLEGLSNIHRLKTGRLIEFSSLAAGLIAEVDNYTMARLSAFGQLLGVVFQMQDDILDVEGDEDVIGKSVGSDEENEKSTFVRLLGLAGAKERLNEEVAAIKRVLEELPFETDVLEQLTDYVAYRKS